MSTRPSLPSAVHHVERPVTGSLNRLRQNIRIIACVESVVKSKMTGTPASDQMPNAARASATKAWSNAQCLDAGSTQTLKYSGTLPKPELLFAMISTRWQQTVGVAPACCCAGSPEGNPASTIERRTPLFTIWTLTEAGSVGQSRHVGGRVQIEQCTVERNDRYFVQPASQPRAGAGIAT